MNYPSSLVYLNSFLNLERIQWKPDNRLWNLKRMRVLLDWFDHPEKDFYSVVIAGTKGKGSTGFFLESILREAKTRVGFYSSPHLEDPRERIRIQGALISPALWTQGIECIHKKLISKRIPGEMGDFTYFEIMTLLAALSFQKAKIKVGIFEVGMGGRLDATRALASRLVLLTPIHLDHQEFLGNTIARIAGEKAAVIPRGADVIVSPQLPEAQKVIERFVHKKKAHLWKVRPVSFPVGLEGDYQRTNAGAAVIAAKLTLQALTPTLSQRETGSSKMTITQRETGSSQIPLSPQGRGKGEGAEPLALKALQKSNWPGRFEIFKGRPTYILDGAHNPASVVALTAYLKKKYPRRDCLLIFGTSRDKNSAQMLKTLSGYFYDIIVTRSASPRSQEIGTLLAEARGKFCRVMAAGSVPEALRLAKNLADKVVITGSFYLIGDARKYVKQG